MDPEDPFNWDVDRTVRELCTDRRKWKVPAASRRMPDPVKLEESLRAHQIDGLALLTDVTEDVLENKLGLRVFGQLAAVKQSIRELRQSSSQYQSWVNEFGSDASLAAHHFVMDTNIKKRLRSLTPGNVKGEEDDGEGSAPGFGRKCSADPLAEKRRRLEDITSDMISNTLDVFQPTDIGQDYELSYPEMAMAIEDDQAGQIGDKGASVEAENPALRGLKCGEVKSPEKKVRRIAPTLITTTIDKERDRKITTQADLFMNNEPHGVPPGVIYKGQDGKKRLTLVSPSAGDFTLANLRQEGLCNGAKRGEEPPQFGDQRGLESTHVSKGGKELADDSSDGYLGKKMHAVDEIFYPGISIGNEIPFIDNEHAFSQGATRVSTGRRLYIHNLMKHYLRSKRQTLHRNGKKLLARIPYSARLAPMHHAPSFTLVHAKNGSSRATRENLLKWPEVDPSLIIKTDKVLSIDDERQALFDLPNNLPLGGPSSYNNWDPDVLEKYRYVHGGDIVLPLYGESDEDGEYDVETWHEIEEERGMLDKPLMAVKKRQLTAEEINMAMDEAVAQILFRWNMDILPKRQLRAWSLWRRSRRQGTKHRLIEEAQQHIDRINNERLPQMRNKVLEEIWTSQKKVRWQTKIMEQSIFDREDLVWRISILKRSAEPERPPLPAAKMRRARIITDEEDGENIETTDVEDSYDEFDDFIVDDDGDILSGEGDNTRADDEAEESIVNSAESGGASSDGGVQSNRFIAKQNSSIASDLAVNESPETDHISPSRVFYSESESELEMPVQTRVWSTPSRLSLRPAATENTQPELPPLKREEVGTQGKSSDIIDLTQLTTDTSGPEVQTTSPNIVDLKTPVRRKNNLKVFFKDQSPTTCVGPLKIKLSETDDVIVPDKPVLLHDLATIAKTTFKELEQAGDRDRILTRIFYMMDLDPKAKLLSLFCSIQAPQMWAHLVDIMHARRDDNFAKVKGMDRDIYKTLSGVIPLFFMYLDCREYHFFDKLSSKVVDKLKDNGKSFKVFHKKCCDILNALFAADTDADSEPLMVRRRESKLIALSDCDSEDESTHTPLKLRKKKISEDLQARDLREQDRLRIVEQNNRRITLRERLALSGDINSDGARVIINDAKLDDQGFIYIHGEIQKRIKDHQIEGIRFMWNQIVTNNLMQGCLLAHTMGLGKTMQVITLLVAIAEAAQSPEESISSQIPESLRCSRTLVLCPPGLIDNWVDELLTWVPLNDRDESALGNCLKIDAIMTLNVRLQVIDAWYRSSGVLIIGYEMFRTLIHNSGGEKKGAPLRNGEHERVLEQLLNGPSIIVADEAHKMKNSVSAITLAARRFRSRSRIALTGSPLANNVEEYHAMIEWVAPNYLGPIAEFRAKYVEPIEVGLWQDSSAPERRRSLKMLGVLKEDLAPKVHRADMSVLRDDLQPKTEFVVTIPLTTLQKDAYTLYVRSMLGMENDLTKNGDLQPKLIWHWFTILTLLCNHPACFQEKLQISWDDAHELLEAKSSEDDCSLWKSGVSEELIRQEMELFKGFGSPIDAIDNSNKVKLLERILDASKAAGDKVLVFSQSIPTLNFLERLCQKNRREYARLDGKTKISTRQASSKEFNVNNTELYLISTTAGGLGLNLPGANRVVIFDFKFNPINEEQAIGRAYRIGQKKPVYVYKFVAGGTFEECTHNQAVFKIQLASRVVDKKKPVAWAKKNMGEFLFEPKDIPQQDLSSFRGKDPRVLDKLLDFKDPSICGIVITDSFQRDDNDELTIEEQREVRQLINEEQLKRLNPAAWRTLSKRGEQEGTATAASVSSRQAAPDQTALLPSRYSQQASAMTPVQFNQHVTPKNSFPPLTSNEVSSLHSSLDMVREVAPITASNTKVRSSLNSTNTTSLNSLRYSHQTNTSGLAERVGSNQSGNILKHQNFERHSRSVGDATSSKRKLPWKPLLDSSKKHESTFERSPLPLQVSPRRILRVAIKQAIGMSKSNTAQSKFSTQKIDEVVSLLWLTIESDAPDSSNEIAQRLKNEPKLAFQLLSGQLNVDDLVKLALSQPTKFEAPSQSSVPAMLPTPKQVQDPKNFAGASSEVLSASQLSNNTKLLPSSKNSNVSPGIASSAMRHHPVTEVNRQEFAQTFEETIQASLHANKPDISFVIPEFSREYCADIAKTVAFEVVAAARDMPHFQTAAALAIKEISKYSVLSDIMNAPDEATHFARKIISQSRGQPAFGLDASSSILSKRSKQAYLSTLPPNPSAETTSRSLQSPHAKADREYLQKLAMRRQSKTSDIIKQRKQDSPRKSNQSRVPKLPKWAVSRIEAANVETRRYRTPSSRDSPVEIPATP